MIEAIPNYVISSTNASSLVLLDSNNIPIIGFISWNWENQNCGCK